MDIARRTVVAVGFAAQIILFARLIGWEAPPWASQDRPYVAAVVRWRMWNRNQSLEEVIFAPNQFSVVHLLDRDPPEMDVLVILAEEALAWKPEDTPIEATHFWSPRWVDSPYWADERCRVEAPTVHHFYNMPHGRCSP